MKSKGPARVAMIEAKGVDIEVLSRITGTEMFAIGNGINPFSFCNATVVDFWMNK